MTSSDNAADEAIGAAPLRVDGAPGSAEADVVLELSEACIAVEGVPVLEGSARVLQGQTVAWVGDWAPVFSLALGRADVLRGAVDVARRPLLEALNDGALSVAPRRLDVVPSWTVREHLEAACRLWRLPTTRAAQAFAELGAVGIAGRKLGTLAPAEQRTLSLLLAVLTRPEVVLVEAPFSELDDAGQRVVARFLSRVAENRAAVVTFDDGDPTALPAPPSPAAWFFESCDAVCHAHSGRILDGVPRRPGGGRPVRFRVTVVGAAEAFGASLAGAVGDAARVERSQLSGIVADRQDASTWIVALESGAGSAAVLDAAAAAGATVVELLPLAPDLTANNP